MKLVIVESPNKVKKIAGFLGPQYQVMASLGHIRDLSKNSLSVVFQDDRVAPHYEISAKEGVVPKLKRAAQEADEVFLATDPDREGEAISWHLAQVLGNRRCRYRRVTFHAITQEAVTKAIAAPRDIDINLVNAQQARRILDRVVGYVVSPTCIKGSGDPKAKSAGRVQSVALRLVVEREMEIRNFISKDFYVLRVLLEKPGFSPSFWARLVKLEGRDVPRGLGAQDRAQALLKSCLQANDWTVVTASISPQRRTPHPPFTTATCQQDASIRLGFNPERTMRLLQELFEGGHITYHRTDSVALAPEAIAMAREVIRSTLASEYLPKEAQEHKSKAVNAQEAHEAIRPTHPETGPSALEGSEAGALYRLIWQRFIASQTSPAVIEVSTIDTSVLGGQAVFRAKGTRTIFDGWQKIYADEENVDQKTESDEAESGLVILPPVSLDDHLKCSDNELATGKTKPPPRYTQASLIKKLDQDGIGRPSTYASIMGRIMACEYVAEKSRKLYATETGIALITFLKRGYPNNFIEPEFTAKMEERLDQIARGEVPWESEISKASHEVLNLARNAGLTYNPLAGEEGRQRQNAEIKDVTKGSISRPCKDCGIEIFWIQQGTKWLPPFNKDGTRHVCKTQKAKVHSKR